MIVMLEVPETTYRGLLTTIESLMSAGEALAARGGGTSEQLRWAIAHEMGTVALESGKQAALNRPVHLVPEST